MGVVSDRIKIFPISGEDKVSIGPQVGGHGESGCCQQISITGHGGSSMFRTELERVEFYQVIVSLGEASHT